MTRDVRIVVVAFRAADALENCLGGLGEMVRHVVVVDNSSSAELREVARVKGAAEYIDAGTNLGFAAGVNVALKSVLASVPADVLLLNPDALLDADAVLRLVEFMRRPGNERLCAVTPRLYSPNRVEQRVLWPFPTPARAWSEALGLGRLPARRRFAIGAALLLRWEALQQVGLFDERFFLYAEEADWQRRASAFGWTATVCPSVRGFHAGAGASEDPSRREAFFHAGQETYVRKWHGDVGWLVYRAAAILGAGARALILAGDGRARAARRVALYARGPRRCAGLAGGT
jgi:GT2 family glycosyltransferase